MKALSSFLMISIILRTLSILSCHFYTTNSLASIQALKPLTPLVIELHPSSSSSTCFQIYIHGNKHSNKYHLEFFATLHGKEAVDGLGRAVKCSVWRIVKAGGNAPLDAMVIHKLLINAMNPNINIFFISSEILKRNQMR